MLLALRRRAVEETSQPFELRVGIKTFARIATRPRLYRTVTTLARRILRRRATNGWITRAPGLAAAWTQSRDLKAPAEQTFEQQWRARAAARRTR